MKEQPQNWYALKVFFNKVFEMETLLQEMGVETYLAVRKVPLKGEDHNRIVRRLATPDDRRQDNMFIQAGPVIFKRIPLVNSLIFAKTDKTCIQEVRKAISGKGFVYMTPDWKEPACIPEKQMTMFRLVTTEGEGLDFFADDDLTRYKAGDRVRVIQGPLTGLEGYIKRIKKDRRLLVSVEGVIAVATSYIPPQYLEKIAESPTNEP